MNEVQYPVFCYGKLPKFGDFIGYNAGSAEVKILDQWIREGLYFAQSQSDQNWDSAYNKSPAYHFLLYPENTQHFLVGILQPSKDRSERKYPFIVSVKIGKKSRHKSLLPVVPVVYKDFLRKAGFLLHRALEGLEKQTIASLAESLNASFQPDPDRNNSTFDNFLYATSLEDFWSMIFNQYNDSRKYLLIKNLTDILLPLRNQDPARMSLGLRFPLGKSHQFLHLVVCFWIRLCLQLLGKKDLALNYFWRKQEKNGQNYLFLFFHQPNSMLFKHLVEPEMENDMICQLDNEGKKDLSEILQKISPEYKNAIDNKELNLMDFIQKF